ncbi:uncharacterized protein LY89DRAFT_682153 [Mollisia scopiformis]|uniref:Uncharacterized protein n=1 Tax=Mollisia scopiformis TaxID=149040 RepID=A0A194XJV0_MOLSC|nr:uncharacterized protein LY89DRAFT_682153 [Mollisia scopiformis]KUJ20416.1 hypothetical protein LY89DRAFT_682153 [Mollisia scopiformis]
MDLLHDLTFEMLRFYHASEPYTKPLTKLLVTMKNETYPLVLPYMNRLAVLAQDSPAIITVGIFLLILLIALQILAVMKRVMMFWFRLVMRLIFWGVVALVISVVMQRGVGRTVEDIMGWGEELSTVWWREYERWEGYQKQQQRGVQQPFGRGNAETSWR